MVGLALLHPVVDHMCVCVPIFMGRCLGYLIGDIAAREEHAARLPCAIGRKYESFWVQFSKY